MCGRISLFTPPEQLARILNAQISAEIPEDRQLRFNLGPTTSILGVAEEADGDKPESDPVRWLQEYRWGLIPSWAKDISVGNRMFNARAETVAEKPSFRSAFKRRRMLVVADGFFEWQNLGSEKQPYYFHRTDGQPLTFAGLYEYWRDSASDKSGTDGIRSCTIITTEAGVDMDGIHDRMPVVLEADVWETWLDPAIEDQEEMLSLLRPATAGTLMHYAVDRRVGNTRNDEADLIKPLEATL
jgi:putative SOS response-associated peptidase YedK